MRRPVRFACAALAGLWLASAGPARAATDPSGDTVSLQTGGPDALVLHGFADSDRMRFIMRLADAAPSPAVMLELDRDSNIATGAVSRVSLLCPELTGLGVERRIEVAAADSRVVVRDDAGAALGTSVGAVSRFDTWLIIDVATDLLGGSPVGASYAGLIGSNEVSDCLPDGPALPIDPQPLRILGGRVSGLDGDTLVLQSEGRADLFVDTNGSFSFPVALEEGSTYRVSVADSGALACEVKNGTGRILGDDVTDVDITCRRVQLPELIFDNGFEVPLTKFADDFEAQPF